MANILINSLFSWFFLICGYFCLWGISDYFLQDPLLALIFFPFSLRLGFVLHCIKPYWFVAYLAEYSVFIFFAFIYPEYQLSIAFILSIFSLPISWIFSSFYRGKQSHKLLLQLVLIFCISLFYSLILYFSHIVNFYYAFLLSLSGGLFILPNCYLISNFLFERQWSALSVENIQAPIQFRAKPILLYIAILALNIYIQMRFSHEFTSFALFFLAIPIILLAFIYGWRGALLATLLNSISLIAATQSFSSLAITDLLLSVSIQTITGIFLGLGIQHLRDLNKHLSAELERNKKLTKKLIHSEEAIRQEISRELHDEIGQNITAIRTQANILKRIEQAQQRDKSADLIDKLSLNIYDTTKGLLNRIRPRLLDDLDLKQALNNLLFELDFYSKNIEVNFDWQNKQHFQLDPLLEVSIYRLCQEALNNIAKYAQATEVILWVKIEKEITILIKDNGVGFNLQQSQQGFGLQGMKERVAILGGEFHIHSIQSGKENISGTSLEIILPRE